MVKQEWKNIFHNTWMKVVMIAIIAIPSIYACVFLGSMWDPYGHSGSLPVAVVNEDQSVEYGESTLDVGNELVKNLKDNQSLEFHFLNATDAMKGLENGEYYMVITIPSDFSKNATTLLDDQPQKMVLNYITNPGTNYIASKMDDSAMAKMKEEVSSSVTKTYAKTIFNQIATLSNGLGEASDGTQQLSDGLHQLVDGNKTISSHLDVLATSSLTFKDGATTLTKGLKDYTDGVVTVHNGIYTLKTGLDTFNDSTDMLADGVWQLNTGVESLSNGFHQYTKGVSQVYTGTQQLVDQNSQIQNAVNSLSEGTLQLFQGSQVLSNGVENISESLNSSLRQSENLKKVSNANDTLDSATILLNQLLLNDQTQVLGKKWLSSQLDYTEMTQLSLNSQAKYLLENYSYNELVEVVTKGNKEAIDQLMVGMNELNTAVNGGTLSNGEKTEGLFIGVKQLQVGLTNLDASVNGGTYYVMKEDQVIDQTTIQQNKALKNGIVAYTNGVQQVNDGVAKLIDKNDVLMKGSQQLSDGIKTLNDQAPTLVSGINALDLGATQIYQGTTELTVNNKTLLNGMNALTTGSSQISAGASQLADGSTTLGLGLDEVNKGVTTLNTSLSDGASQSQLSTDASTFDMLASPVETTHDEISVVENNGHAMAPYMMSVALYVCALAFTLMYPVLEGAKESESGWKYWLSKATVMFSVSTLAAIIMITSLRFINGFEPQQLLKTYLFAILVAAAFMALIVLLNITTGYIGEFLLLVFMIINLGGSAGTYPLETSTGFFKAIHYFVPYTYSVDGFRKVISMTNANISTEACVFIGILVISSVLTIVYYTVKKNKTEHIIPQAFEKHE